MPPEETTRAETVLPQQPLPPTSAGDLNSGKPLNGPVSTPGAPAVEQPASKELNRGSGPEEMKPPSHQAEFPVRSQALPRIESEQNASPVDGSPAIDLNPDTDPPPAPILPIYPVVRVESTNQSNTPGSLSKAEENANSIHARRLVEPVDVVPASEVSFGNPVPETPPTTSTPGNPDTHPVRDSTRAKQEEQNDGVPQSPNIQHDQSVTRALPRTQSDNGEQQSPSKSDDNVSNSDPVSTLTAVNHYGKSQDDPARAGRQHNEGNGVQLSPPKSVDEAPNPGSTPTLTPVNHEAKAEDDLPIGGRHHNKHDAEQLSPPKSIDEVTNPSPTPTLTAVNHEAKAEDDQVRGYRHHNEGPEPDAYEETNRLEADPGHDAGDGIQATPTPVWQRQPLKLLIQGLKAVAKIPHFFKGYLVLALAANIALWASTMYQVVEIDGYYAQGGADRYRLLSWAAIFFPIFVLVTCIVLACVELQEAEPPEAEPPKAELPEAEAEDRSFWDRIKAGFRAVFHIGPVKLSIVVTEIACFVLVIVYVQVWALPEYGRLKWEAETDFRSTMAPPAVWVFGNYNDAPTAYFNPDETKCYFPAWSKDGTRSCSSAFPAAYQWLNSTKYGDMRFYNYTPPNTDRFQHLSDALLLQVWFNWNSSDIHIWYDTNATQNPYMFVALGDPRVPIELAIECGVRALSEIPALGSTTFAIVATEVVDHLGMLNVTDANPKCRDIYRLDPPFTSYSFHAVSGGSSNGSVCDVSSPQYQTSCFSQLIFRFSTFSVTRATTKHGLEKIEILIAIGAIVGAVQFLAWHLGLFST